MKIYAAVIRTILSYETETWAPMRKEEALFERTKMRMVRWNAGISLPERKESKDIRRICGKSNVRKKAKEAYMKYYDHVIKREKVAPIKRAETCQRWGGRSWHSTVTTDAKFLAFENQALRRILGIKWQQHITNAGICEFARVSNMDDIVRLPKWRRMEHITRREYELVQDEQYT
ncbi:uncharacterized protein [Palaemon carinicauda]|uniref:uncharacterized protein n=1 Tax=Palaemon carinicauda TaxID=392227 RepID=UPI0035B64E49